MSVTVCFVGHTPPDTHCLAMLFHDREEKQLLVVAPSGTSPQTITTVIKQSRELARWCAASRKPIATDRTAYLRGKERAVLSHQPAIAAANAARERY